MHAPSVIGLIELSFLRQKNCICNTTSYATSVMLLSIAASVGSSLKYTIMKDVLLFLLYMHTYSVITTLGLFIKIELGENVLVCTCLPI